MHIFYGFKFLQKLVQYMKPPRKPEDENDSGSDTESEEEEDEDTVNI